MSSWKLVEAGVLSALVHQLIRAALTLFVLGPLYLERGQLWRFPGDLTVGWLPLVSLFLGFSLAYVYRRVGNAIISVGWRRGVKFGFWVWMIASVPYHGGRFALMPITPLLALGETAGDLVAYLISGIMFARLLDPRGPAASRVSP